MSEFEQLRAAKTVLLTTHKRDGSPVATPVSRAFDGERAYFCSWQKAWKTKRLARDPRVTLRGRKAAPAGGVVVSWIRAGLG